MSRRERLIGSWHPAVLPTRVQVAQEMAEARVYYEQRMKRRQPPIPLRGPRREKQILAMELARVEREVEAAYRANEHLQRTTGQMLPKWPDMQTSINRDYLPRVGFAPVGQLLQVKNETITHEYSTGFEVRYRPAPGKDVNVRGELQKAVDRATRAINGADADLFARAVCAGIASWRDFKDGTGRGEVILGKMAYGTRLTAGLPVLHEDLRARIEAALKAEKPLPTIDGRHPAWSPT